MVKIPLGYPLKLALDCEEDIGRPQYPRGLIHQQWYFVNPK